MALGSHSFMRAFQALLQAEETTYAAFLYAHYFREKNRHFIEELWPAAIDVLTLQRRLLRTMAHDKQPDNVALFQQAIGQAQRELAGPPTVGTIPSALAARQLGLRPSMQPFLGLIMLDAPPDIPDNPAYEALLVLARRAELARTFLQLNRDLVGQATLAEAAVRTSIKHMDDINNLLDNNFLTATVHEFRKDEVDKIRTRILRENANTLAAMATSTFIATDFALTADERRSAIAVYWYSPGGPAENEEFQEITEDMLLPDQSVIPRMSTRG